MVLVQTFYHFVEEYCCVFINGTHFKDVFG